MGPADLGERVGLAHPGTQLTSGRPLEQVGQRLLHHVPAAEAVHQPEAHHGAALAHQAARLERVLLPAGDPVGHDSAEGRERLGAGVEGAPPGHLQRDVDPAALVGLHQRGGEVLLGGIDGGVGAQLETERALLLAAGRGDHPAGAEGLGQLHGQAPHAAGARDHDHRLAGGQLRAGPVEVPGGEPLDQQGEGGALVEAVGDLEHRLPRRHGVLGVAPAPQQSDHPATVLGAARDLAAEDQRDLVAGQVRVLALVGVGEVQAGP